VKQKLLSLGKKNRFNLETKTAFPWKEKPI
jgi:hypothetical protein